MEAQKHRNVSAVETRRRFEQIDTRCFLLALLAMASLGVYGCGHNPPKDKNGNLPDDTVRNWIELAEEDDYEPARKLWYGPSERVQPMKFEDFCARYKKIGHKNFKISKAVKGKAGYSAVRIDWEESGKKKHVFEYLKIIDSEWRMVRGHAW